MSKKIIQYIRVSTEGQNTERQENSIVMGASVYKDLCSGSIAFKDRPVASELIDEIKEGRVKEVHVHSIDRLGRNTLDIMQTIQFMTDNGVNVISTKEGLRTLNEDGTENPMSKLLVGVLGTIAEFEYSRIKERQREGIENAKAKGVYQGRLKGASESLEQFLNKPKVKTVMKHLNAGESIRRTALLSKCSTGLVQKVLRAMKDKYETDKMIEEV